MTSRTDPFRQEQDVALRRAVIVFRRAQARADGIMADARRALADHVREAYAEGTGLRKSDILRAIDYERSRTWIDEILRSEPAEQ